MFRLSGLESKTRNGTAKWKRIKERPIHSPAPVEPTHVPGDLLGQVAGPDDQELREREVAPEHRERQEQVAQVVERLRLIEPLELALVSI